MVRQITPAFSPSRLAERLGSKLRQLQIALRKRAWLLTSRPHRATQRIWKTKEGIDIVVRPGKKSQSDFIVFYKDNKRSRRWRTPKHIHLIVELYVKEAHDPELTYQLRDHLISIFDKIQPIEEFPPRLQVYQRGDEERFKNLDAVGEFSVEFMLIVSELIFIQEKTNYREGSLTKDLYQAFGNEDRFRVIHRATFRGRGR